MRSIKSARLLFGLLLALLAIPAMAATVSYPFRVVDNSGNLVSGATVVINGTTLTAGTSATVTGKVLGSGATLSSVSVTYYDFGSGDYVLTYDPAANGEAYFPITVSKSGSTITGANSLVGLVCALDSSKVNQALPNAAPNTSGGYPTIGTGSGQINPDGTGALPVSMTQVLPTSPTAGTSGEALFYADQKIGRRGTAQGGTTTTITLDAGASSVDNAYSNHLVKITSGTGGGQFATITGYVGATKVATITRPAGSWGTTPDNTSVFLIEPEPEAQVYSNLDKSGYALTQAFPSNFPSLNIDGSGKVVLQTSEHTAIQADAATGVLVTPSQKLATDSSGSPVLSVAVLQAIRDTNWGKLIDGTLTAQDVLVLDTASLIGKETNTWSSSNHANTGVRFRQDGTTAAYTNVTQYGTTQTALPATGVTSTVNTPLH